MTPRIVIDNSNRPATVADLEIWGMELGILHAQRLIRGYAVTALQPDTSSLAVDFLFRGIVEDFVNVQRTTNGLTDDGEVAYRKGYRRGLQSQMKHPNAKIEIKRVAANV